MAEKIRVIHCGLGPIGSGVARLAAQRGNLELVGAVDVDPRIVGKDLGEVIGAGRKLGVIVSGDAAATYASNPADVVVHCTGSSLKAVLPQIELAARQKLNLISTCEELSNPRVHNPDLVAALDSLARANGVSILGTGVNPGYAMDALPIMLMLSCAEVRRVRLTRILDAGRRRGPLQKKVGAGLSIAEFQVKAGAGIVRHVGLLESVGLIADSLGWGLDRTEENIWPVVAEEAVKTDFVEVRAGQVAGVRQVARGLRGGEEVIRLELQMYVGAKDPQDRVEIDGTPNVKSVIEGGLHGDIATAAIVVNSIPALVQARPGLQTVRDVPPAPCAIPK